MKPFILTTLLVMAITGNGFAQDVANAGDIKTKQPAAVSKSHFSFLDEPGSRPAFAGNSYPAYQLDPEDEAKWRRTKGAGMALMIAGGASMITGLAFIERGVFHSGNRERKIETGIIFLLAGSAGLGPGIPMFIKSNRELKKIKKQRGELSLHPTGTGGRLVYKF